MKVNFAQKAVMFSALILGAGLTAPAAVTTVGLTISDYTSRAEYGFAGTLPGSPGTLEGNGYYGAYEFTASGATGPNASSIPGSFWSTCLSPSGNYANGNFTELTYAQANPGLDPNHWAYNGTDYWGIQNAQYLWRLYGPGVVATGNQDKGAGLAMAMYKALYDSTGYGVIGGANHFNVTTWVGASQSYYNTYLAALNPTAVSANLATGYVLVPSGDVTLDASGNFLSYNPSGAGQEFVLNFSPVPEPTTLIASALLLLPFGASTLRVLRTSRKAY